MSLSEKVSTIISIHTQELYLLLQFVRDFNTYIYYRRDQDIFLDIPDNIKSEFMQYLGEFHDFFGTVLSETQQSSSIKVKRWVFKPKKSYSREVEKRLIPLLIAVYKPIRYPKLLYNMALTHAIAIFESFLSDFLVAIFTQRPSTLKSESVATYEQILSFPSMEQLIDHLATTRVKKILSDNIDEVANHVNKLFSIDILRFNDWDILREASYRRNIIIHNNGITDSKYCERIPNSQTGVHLTTDFEYMETLFTALGQFIDCLDSNCSRKMRYKRNPVVNQLLNPPESISELGGNSP